MTKLGHLAACLMLTAAVCFAQGVWHFIHGTVEKVDHATKTVVVKTADGAEHTVKITGETAIKGSKDGLTDSRKARES